MQWEGKDARRSRLRSSTITQLERSKGWSGLKRLRVRSTLMCSFSLKCGTGLWRTASGLLIASERRYVPGAISQVNNGRFGFQPEDEGPGMDTYRGRR